MNIKIKIGADGNNSWEQMNREREKTEEQCGATELLSSHKKQTMSVERDSDLIKERQGMAAIYAEMERLIGLEQVKKMVLEIEAFAEIQKLRREQQLNTGGTVLHCVFKGNPGTGKTTVARIMAKMLKEIGILEKGHLVEIERADLVGEYIGHTAQKTREQVKKAMGGVLFIDEAYALARGDQKDFGREAIEVILKAMEDYRGNLIVILAGYPEEMEYFLSSNPGLKSRFPLHIDFPDYSLKDLGAIAEQMYGERDYALTEAGADTLALALETYLKKDGKNHGNARLIRNIAEASIRAQAVRLLEGRSGQLNKSNLMEIIPADITAAMQKIAVSQGKEKTQGSPQMEIENQLNQIRDLSKLVPLLQCLPPLSYEQRQGQKQRFEVV